MLERAIKQRWDLERVKPVFLKKLRLAVGACKNARDVAAIGRVVVAMEAQNQKDEHFGESKSSGNRFLELAEKLGIGTIVEAVPAIGTNSDTSIAGSPRSEGSGTVGEASEEA